MSLTEGRFPNKLKKAVVTPLIKKPSLAHDDLKITNLYQAYVSSQNWLVAVQLKRHINGCHLDNPLQSAYKVGHPLNPPCFASKTKFTPLLPKV